MLSQASSSYAVILAGGSGTRFWPLSRHALPKQLMRLFDDASLLEQAIARLAGLIPAERILILTNHEQEAAVRAALPHHPAENIVAEPAKRDTAPAVALGIGWVAARDPEATMAILPADHLIQDAAAFRHVLAGALTTAQATHGLVTIGIKPTWPCPSYGYIERGSRATVPALAEDLAALEVIRFREKPNQETAEQFLAEGARYVWNAGMFVWSVPAVLDQLTQHCAPLAHFVRELASSRDFTGTIAAQFPTLPKISIDYALMEKASRVLNLEATFDWDDVGNWTSVAKYLKHDADDNAHQADLTAQASSGNIVYSQLPTKIGLLGVSDLIIVQTPDALLIANKHQADQIKKLVDLLPPELQ
jgi:mannose-1-phosphate guanylyltransferase